MKTATVFGNETAAQILALLSSIAGEELHTNEIIRRINGNPRAVQRALIKSEAAGLISSRRIGNLRLWRMDPSNPLYPSMRETFARTRGIPARLTELLAKMAGVRLAFLFGSYVAAKDDPTSDIDIFVAGTPDWVALSEALRAAGRQLGRIVNPIVWSEADLADLPESNRAFLDSVLAGPMMWLVGDRAELDGLRSNVGADLGASRPARAPVSSGRQGPAPEGTGSRGGRESRPRRQPSGRGRHPR